MLRHPREGGAIDGDEVPENLTGPWADILLAQRRLDRVPLRRLVATVLRDVSRPSAGDAGRPGDDDPLQGWKRLGQAMRPGDEGRLDEHLSPGAAGLDWAARAAGTVEGLLALVPVEHEDRDVLVLLVLAFCYFECIVFWEYTTDHEPMEEILALVTRRATERADALAAETDPAPVRRESARLLRTVAAAAVALGEQFTVEGGWLCGCAVRTTRTAGRAVDALDRAQVARRAGPVATTAPEPSHPALRGAVAGLDRVLAESVDDARCYFDLLHRHVGPAAMTFSENLFERADDSTTLAVLRGAREAVTAAVEPGGGRDPAIAGVFRSEARAQGRALDAMLALLGEGEGREAEPTLVVDQGEVHYLYPFGLPVDADGEDPAQALLEGLRAMSSPGRELVLAGCPVTVEDVLQTELFVQASGVLEAGASSRSGAWLVFADHRLVLETSAGVRYAGLDIEVLLGPLGNHLVRVSVSTATPLRWCTADADHGEIRPCPGEWQAIPSRWTPHELDLFVRRGGTDFGDERLYFAPEGGDLAHDPPPASAGWTSIIELAARVVADLGALAAAPGGGAGEAREVTADELRQQAHVLVVLSEAGRAIDGRTARIGTPADLAACRGAVPVLTSQPPSPRVPDEWTCAPPLAPSLLTGSDGLVGSMDSQILCNGDTTLMFVPSSPNWQVIEDRELVMFALSLGSAYARQRRLLLVGSEQAMRLDTSEEFTAWSRQELDEMAAAVRVAEQRLTRHVGFADSLLDHARGAVVIRPRRDRALLDHVAGRSGVVDLQEAMSLSRQTAADRLADLRDVAGRVVEAQRSRGQAWVERFLLAMAVLGFIDLLWWFFDVQRDAYAWNWTAYFWAGFSALLLVGALIGVAVFRRTGSATRRRRVE